MTKKRNETSMTKFLTQTTTIKIMRVQNDVIKNKQL